MKTCCILTFGRTGSSWLCDALGGQNTINLQEIFSLDVYSWMRNMELILFQEDSSSHIKKFFNKYLGCSLIQKLDVNFYKKLINDAIETQPYSEQFILEVLDLIIKNKKKAVFKIFKKNIDTFDVKPEFINQISDSFILNYRDNILNAFISQKIADHTWKWFKFDEKVEDQPLVAWDELEFVKYSEETVSKYNFFNKLITDSKKPFLNISYEEIHAHNTENEKLNFLQEKLKQSNIDFVVSNKTYLKKQSKFNIINNSDAINIFSNPNDFLISENRGAIKTLKEIIKNEKF